MSQPNITDFLAYLRRDDYGSGGDPLEPVAQLALDSATDRAEKFIGDSLSDFADSFGDLPSSITSAIYMLARCEFDDATPEGEHVLRDRAESLLRPYRRETGFAASTCTTE